MSETDPVHAYLVARDHLTAVEKRFQIMVEKIRRGAEMLISSDWEYVEVSEMSPPVPFTKGSGSRKVITDWPTAKEIGNVLTELHNAYQDATELYSKVDKKFHAGLVKVPDKSQSRSPHSRH
jgi:hypothetical protein